MTLYNFAKQMDNKITLSQAIAIETALKKRFDYLENHEPISDSAYDKWEEKMEDIDSIIRDVQLLIQFIVNGNDLLSKDGISLVACVKKDIIIHQAFYSGMKKLSINIKGD